MEHGRSSPKLVAVQQLRALAALSVVMFHTLGTAQGYGLQSGLLLPLLGWGSQGVDLFFVVSGFIMVFIQNRHAATPAQFFLNRVRRIAPLYWVLTLCFVALYYLIPGFMNSTVPSGSRLAASLMFVSQLVLGQWPVIFDGWSLEYEIIFYAVFAVSLFLPGLRASAAACAAFLLLGAVLWHLPLLCEFALGLALGILYTSGWRPPTTVPFWAIASGLAIYLLAGLPDIPLPRSLICGTAAGLLLFGAVFMPAVSEGLLSRIGDASYSVYLIQVFSIPAIYKLAKSTAIGNASPTFTAFASFVLTSFAGWLVYRYLERPITAYAHRSTSPRPAIG
jgi:exopolysaccharide production protein ExoZ